MFKIRIKLGSLSVYLLNGNMVYRLKGKWTYRLQLNKNNQKPKDESKYSSSYGLFLFYPVVAENLVNTIV